MARDNHPRERQGRKLERKIAALPPHDRILIVCEGGKTEPNYFTEIKRKYRLANAKINIFPCQTGTSPLQVVEYAEKLFKEGDTHRIPRILPKAFDQVYSVFDRDEHLNYHDALVKAQSLNGRLRNDEKKYIIFKAIVSIPCFELWLLLHFRDVLSPMPRADVISALKTFYTDYQKGQDGHFKRTEGSLPEAIKRAEKLAESHDPTDEGPYTNVHQLVQTLQNLPTH